MSPRLSYDTQYQNFFKLLNDQVVTALTNVHAFEEERKRVEALAEIDRAKTAFFSNISHEFRTPLTLMLGPLEELLHSEENLKSKEIENVEAAHRNAIRLLRLVNTLLDFSKIESGRTDH
jgi:K+-sensing histidine kinase KdpD